MKHRIKKKKVLAPDITADRLEPSEETVPKLSTSLTSERVIPNYEMKPPQCIGDTHSPRVLQS